MEVPLAPLLIIARLTLREAARRRLLLAVAILTIIVVGLTGWGFSKLATVPDASGQLPSAAELRISAAGFVILIAYMFSVVLAAGAAFLAAPAIAADVENGLLLAILPRPLRRSDLVLGRWLGLVILVVAYTATAAALEFTAVRLTTGYTPPRPVEAVACLAGQSIVLLTLALLASSRLAPITGGIIALVLFGLAWIAGIVEALGLTFHNSGLSNGGAVFGLLLPTDGLWRGAVYNLEPAVMAAIGGEWARGGNPFAVTEPPTTAYLVWVVGWIAAALGLAIFSFGRRDL